MHPHSEGHSIVTNAETPNNFVRLRDPKSELDRMFSGGDKANYGRGLYGAGDGNRTHVRSLGSFYTTIVRRPLTVSDCTQESLVGTAISILGAPPIYRGSTRSSPTTPFLNNFGFAEYNQVGHITGCKRVYQDLAFGWIRLRAGRPLALVN